MKSKSTLLIIAGAAGEIGTEYCKAAIENQIDCIGIIRERKTGLLSPRFKEIACHLDNIHDIEKAFSKINFASYERIIYLHTIGTDKFDPRGYPKIRAMNTIDPDVYHTNVNSFKYFLRFCAKQLAEINLAKEEKISFRCAIVSGVADKYAPFVIESFCEAKFILRQYIQSYVHRHPDWISGLSINISSTITASALRVRPHADTKYWLTPKDVVEKTFKMLLRKFKSYKEFDIIKYSPEFVSNYYTDNKLLYSKWSKETGIF